MACVLLACKREQLSLICARETSLVNNGSNEDGNNVDYGSDENDVRGHQNNDYDSTYIYDVILSLLLFLSTG